MAFLAAIPAVVQGIGAVAGAAGALGGGGGGKNTQRAQAATGDAAFTNQNLQPAIANAQSDYSSQLGQANQVYQNQGNLANQLLAQSQGQGPNIAQMQLQQATDRNNQQAAGAMASQRGMNPALAARLIAQNQASNNQQAAGQSGLMRAQQQLAAQGALANVYGQQAGQSLQGGSIANQNLGINQQALSQQNAQIVAAHGAANEINAKAAQANADNQAKITGGLIGGIGGALTGLLGTKNPPTENALEGATPIAGTGNAAAGNGSYNDNAVNMGGAAHGGEAPDYREGGHVPGKAAVEGDSAQNDTVHAILSPGEVVLPRSVTKSDDPEGRAAEFMRALQKEKGKEAEPKGFSKILEAKRKMAELMEHIDSMHKVIKKGK